jgi:hypothetical protein
MEAAVTALFDEATNTVSYIVADPATAKAWRNQPYSLPRAGLPWRQSSQTARSTSHQ